MRLQNKNFTFNVESGDRPFSRLLTSNLVIDGKLTDILLSDLFYGTRKENKNTIKGFSILELVKDNKIQINERIYELSFTGDKDNFVLQSINEPNDFTYNDKTMSESESSAIEKRIIESAPAIQQQEQPPVEETSNTELTTHTDETGANLFKNSDYNKEREMNLEFTEYNTIPISNMKLLVDEISLQNDDEQNEENTTLTTNRNLFLLLDD